MFWGTAAGAKDSGFGAILKARAEENRRELRRDVGFHEDPRSLRLVRLIALPIGSLRLVDFWMEASARGKYSNRSEVKIMGLGKSSCEKLRSHLDPNLHRLELIKGSSCLGASCADIFGLINRSIPENW